MVWNLKYQRGTVKFRSWIVLIWHLGDEEGQKVGGVYRTEKKLQNTEEALILSSIQPLYHSCLKSFLWKQFYMVRAYLHGFSSHICSTSVNPEKNCWLLRTEPEFSICLPHYISQGIGGQNLQTPWPHSCFKPLHNPLQIPQASQCVSSWHAFPPPGLMECSRIFRWFSMCFINLRRY